MTESSRSDENSKAAARWEAIYRRLDALRDSLQTEWTSPVAEKEAILRARAKELAREPDGSEPGGDSMEVLELLLGHERYGIESAYVREVRPLKQVTPVPCTPAFVLGLISVRGQIYSVVDLKKIIDLPRTEPGDLAKVIILHNENMEFGILADRVLGVCTISPRDLQPAPASLTGIGARYLRGITGEGMVVLAAENILSDPSIVVGA